MTVQVIAGGDGSRSVATMIRCGWCGERRAQAGIGKCQVAWCSS